MGFIKVIRLYYRFSMLFIYLPSEGTTAPVTINFTTCICSTTNSVPNSFSFTISP